MVCYLSNNLIINIIFIMANISIGYAIYLANIVIILKLIIFIIAVVLNCRALIANRFIKAFYLSISKNKSILLTKYNTEIKVNFVKVTYYNSFLVIICFVRGTKYFIIPIFKNMVTVQEFKCLQLLARYNFLPILC